jgi:hypothetical protein
MAEKLMWMEGYGKYGTSFSSGVAAGRYNVMDAGSVSSTEFASGAKGIKFGSITNDLQATFSSATGSTVIIGLRFELGALPASEGGHICELLSTVGVNIGAMVLTTAGALKYVLGAKGQNASVVTANTGLVVGQEVFLEMKVKLSTGSTIGTVAFWRNGIADGSGTGKTINASTPLVVQRITLGAGSEGGAFTGGRIPLNSVIGDVYVKSGGSPYGDVTVSWWAANTDSTETGEDGWTPSSGTDHAALIDEAPADGDTTYISAGSSTPLDRFAMATVSTGVTYKAVQQLGYAKKLAAGAGSYRFSNILSTDSTVSATHGITTSYEYDAAIWEVNPAGNPWTRTGINDTRWGVQRTTA